MEFQKQYEPIPQQNLELNGSKNSAINDHFNI